MTDRTPSPENQPVFQTDLASIRNEMEQNRRISLLAAEASKAVWLGADKPASPAIEPATEAFDAGISDEPDTHEDPYAYYTEQVTPKAEPTRNFEPIPADEKSRTFRRSLKAAAALGVTAAAVTIFGVASKKFDGTPEANRGPVAPRVHKQLARPALGAITNQAANPNVTLTVQPSGEPRAHAAHKSAHAAERPSTAVVAKPVTAAPAPHIASPTSEQVTAQPVTATQAPVTRDTAPADGHYEHQPAAAPKKAAHHVQHSSLPSGGIKYGDATPKHATKQPSGGDTYGSPSTDPASTGGAVGS